jgi:hypothetical protein
MAEIISGDRTKGIKNVGELALRISRFDSYRLFTLYENAQERKIMDVSGNQKYYLVFRSPSKEIRIPEYDPKGFFEVDKVNGCILFKITKKNAEDILGMKTAGEKIFHIIRTYEERDSFGKVLSVTDEVEVYHGKWGDDEAFTTFTTENKVDLLTKSLAVQIDKNATQLNEYKDLQEKHNLEVQKNSELEKEIEQLRAENESLQTQINEYLGDTYDGTILSTDTKYIAFENTLENVSFTEEQYKTAIDEMLSKGEVMIGGESGGGEEGSNKTEEPTLDIILNKGGEIGDKLKYNYMYSIQGCRNDEEIFSVKYEVENGQVKTNNINHLYYNVSALHGAEFKFKCDFEVGRNEYYPSTGRFDEYDSPLELYVSLDYENSGTGFKEAVKFGKKESSLKIRAKEDYSTNSSSDELNATIDYSSRNNDSAIYGIGNIGVLRLKCDVKESMFFNY